MFSLKHPYSYLFAYVAVLYVRPHEYVPWLIGVPILPVLLLSAFLAWLLQKNKPLDAPQHRLVPVLYFFIVFSVLLTGWMTGTLKALTDFLPTVMLFFMLSTSVDTTARMRGIFAFLGAAGALMAVHGIDQAGTEDGVGWTGAKMIQNRITYLGFLNDPNDLAMALLMGLPMALLVADTARSFFVRWAYRAFAGLAIYGVYLTNSRGGLLSLAAMCVMYSLLRFGVGRGMLVLPVLAAALIVFAPSRGSEISADEDSAAGRVEAWYEGFQMLFYRPVFGVGYNMFIEHHIRTAHNSFVLAIAELGVVGYYVWLSNLALSVGMLVQIERMRSPDATASPDQLAQWQDVRQANRALLYGTVAALVASMFLSRSYTVIWYVQIGLVVAIYQQARRVFPRIEPVTFGRYWGRLLLLSNGSIVFFWLATRVLL